MLSARQAGLGPDTNGRRGRCAMRHIKYDTQNIGYRVRIVGKYGFTVAEVLLSLAIASVLLAAVATAFNASIVNYRENENIFVAINSVRQALFRITTQLRTAEAVDPNASSNEVTMITSAGDNITYRYNDEDNKLYLVTNDDLYDDDYVLCENVTDATFTKETVIEDTEIKVKSVQISMTVISGSEKRTVASAAVIRRNLD
jgi:prepilin-type N-terminal cleavage/methylation domain-containing protein